MSTKYTPGPWIWQEGHRGLYGAGPDNAVLNYASYEGMWLSWDQGQEVANANARLIAAAPELLQALEAMLGMHEEGATLHGLVGPTVEAARAAIAKATGAPK